MPLGAGTYCFRPSLRSDKLSRPQRRRHMRLSAQETNPSEVEADELLALLDRVSRSPQLRRASRLRELLLYLGKRSIVEGRTDLHEQEIGCAVFGRPSYYDTSQDNIVRVNATELRKRLESYFATDGAHEAWILEIPRGGYSPVFSRRELAAPAAGEMDPRQSISSSASVPSDVRIPYPTSPRPIEPATRNRRFFVIAAGTIAVLCTACMYLFWQNRLLHQQMHGW